MNWWICSECDYVFQVSEPPQTCPSCRRKCVFSDVTCYVPECGGPGNLDMKLVATKARAAKKRVN